MVPEEEKQRRAQARREQGLRLKTIAEKRRKEKVRFFVDCTKPHAWPGLQRKQQEDELKELKATQEMKETDPKKFGVLPPFPSSPTG